MVKVSYVNIKSEERTKEVLIEKIMTSGQGLNEEDERTFLQNLATGGDNYYLEFLNNNKQNIEIMSELSPEIVKEFKELVNYLLENRRGLVSPQKKGERGRRKSFIEKAMINGVGAVILRQYCGLTTSYTSSVKCGYEKKHDVKLEFTVNRLRKHLQHILVFGDIERHFVSYDELRDTLGKHMSMTKYREAYENNLYKKKLEKEHKELGEELEVLQRLRDLGFSYKVIATMLGEHTSLTHRRIEEVKEKGVSQYERLNKDRLEILSKTSDETLTTVFGKKLDGDNFNEHMIETGMYYLKTYMN